MFLRFLTPIRELSASQVDYLINVDFDDHVAYAVVADEPGYPGMAITRYIRSFDNPEEADIDKRRHLACIDTASAWTITDKGTLSKFKHKKERFKKAAN